MLDVANDGFRVVELGVDGDEEANGIVEMHAVEYKNFVVVIVEGDDGLLACGSYCSHDLAFSKLRARAAALERLQRLRQRRACKAQSLGGFQSQVSA